MNTKLLIIAAVALFAIGNAMAQHAVTQAAYPNDVERTIVREYNYPATVSYVETSVKHYFAYADASMTVTNCEISHDLYVTDLVLHGDFAYFCGYNDISGTGVWGWFKVASLASGNLNYYIYDDFVCNNLYADSLFDLDVFEEKGQLHIVTVGSTTDGASKKRPCHRRDCDRMELPDGPVGMRRAAVQQVYTRLRDGQLYCCCGVDWKLVPIRRL